MRWPVSRSIRAWSTAGSAAEPDTSRRARANGAAISGSFSAASAIRWYIVGTPNIIVAPRRRASASTAGEKRRVCSTEPPQPQRPEHADHQAVDVEERERLGEPVVAGPLPDRGERVEVRLDRPARDLNALRRAGRAGRVEDEGGVLGPERVGQRRPGRDVEGDVDALDRGELLCHLGAGAGEQQLGLGVGGDVLELAAAVGRVDRDDRDARGERAEDGDADLRLVLGPDGDAACRRHCARLSAAAAALSSA